MEGFGRYIYETGDIFVGQFKAGKFQGKGRYSFANGTVMEGLFDDGQPVDSCSVCPEWLEEQLSLSCKLEGPEYPFTLSFDESIFQ
jgi:hypothetical protein